ncbi:MAG: 3-isopropylmalate dehydratase small subunit [Gammaproteobacteria bacterium]|nr:3-isopropylmalate dehydratase small subunit [Gammaproteobacteria bacterium]
MNSFTSLTSRIIPLPHNDVDTDQIIPAVYLKVTDKEGLVEGLFQRWRYTTDGELNPAFPLNKPEYQGAEILLAGDNFGCGSSREHAPWALTGWGLRAVISTSFADIFRSNALKNGLLPIVVDEETHQDLFDLTEETTEAAVQIDLAAQTLTLPNGRQAAFPIDAFSKTCLLEGIDQLGYLLKKETEIAAFEAENGK